MASSRNRQRALARAKLERQMARRAATARKRRQTLAIIGIVAAVLVVGGGTGAFIWANAGKDTKKKASASASATATPAAASCYKKATAQSGQKLKDVGMPSNTDVPKSGTQTMTIKANIGEIDVKLDTAKAPCNVNSFAYLAGKKFFDKTTCHRMTTKASGLEVLQCGDPSGTGSGGPTYTVKDENLPTGKKPTYPTGTVAVANTGQAGSGSSQFFIVYGNSDLPASYTVIGTVTKGLDKVQAVAKKGVTGANAAKGDGAPKEKVTIDSLRVSAATGASPSPSGKS
ncbi:peptidylprolyl isomerase [Actinocatenispora rupis]|uniref:Peptidyl-prolyl cis-trans isomerase n=1 Tax=Actinocatenispora rupis TaxID=519421 RepID=A0A8J3J0E8_9ACTN|nr:peptidylprolyl isomerase [Actinocatenispora rupis]GID09647.1 peptidyl-prolyl cis-trans isomerase [Actinocatenispora rupis]